MAPFSISKGEKCVKAVLATITGMIKKIDIHKEIIVTSAYIARVN